MKIAVTVGLGLVLVLILAGAVAATAVWPWWLSAPMLAWAAWATYSITGTVGRTWAARPAARTHTRRSPRRPVLVTRSSPSRLGLGLR